MEGDSLQVINLIHSRRAQWIQAGLFVQDGISMLNSLCSWSAKHTSRVTNEAAHYLARFSLNLIEDMYDFSSVPVCIFKIVRLDACLMK